MAYEQQKKGKSLQIQRFCTKFPLQTTCTAVIYPFVRRPEMHGLRINQPARDWTNLYDFEEPAQSRLDQPIRLRGTCSDVKRQPVHIMAKGQIHANLRLYLIQPETSLLLLYTVNDAA